MEAPLFDQNPSSRLVQYTLSTGKLEESDRCSQELIDRLRPLATTGGAIPGHHAFHLEVFHGNGSSMFSVRHGRDPVATCGLAWTEEGARKVWLPIEKQYLDLSDLLIPYRVGRDLGAMVTAEAKKPVSLPWLGVVLYPLKGKVSPPDIRWLPEFERCLAWTILAAPVEPALSDHECNKLYQDGHRAGAAGKMDVAEHIFRRLVTNRPCDAEYALGLGRVLRELGKHEEALESLKRAELLNPQDRMTQCEIGGILIAAERFSEAEKRFRRVLSMPANSIDHPSLTACAQNGLAACLRMRSAD